MIKIYCDGSCLGNPGPGGWCAILQHPSSTAEKILKGGAPHTTNNQMELTAALMALNAVTKDITIEVYTDSQYLQKGIGEWSKKWLQNGFKTADKKPIKNQELWRALLTHRHLARVSFHWVKGHAGHAENERADVIARGEAER
ncbi:MAG: ribonuclease HI, partial [Hydrotalea sp.]|nr:ribonuclease HI [Hydrotalea sp.]